MAAWTRREMGGEVTSGHDLAVVWRSFLGIAAKPCLDLSTQPHDWEDVLSGLMEDVHRLAISA